MVVSSHLVTILAQRPPSGQPFRLPMLCDVIDATATAEPARQFLRRGAVVVVALAALTGLAVVLTSRNDAATARGLCTRAARAQFAAPVKIVSVDRTGDDTFVVRGAAGPHALTCLVTREPVSDRWELASVS
jgi:hypothetical protein